MVNHHNVNKKMPYRRNISWIEHFYSMSKNPTAMTSKNTSAESKANCVWANSILDYTSPFRSREDENLSKAYPFNSVFREEPEEE